MSTIDSKILELSIKALIRLESRNMSKDTHIIDTDLPDIPANHMEFARALAKGLGKTEAYRKYVSDAGEPNTTWANASRLAASDKVKAWRNAIRREMIDEIGAKEVYTLAEHIKDLDELAEEAKTAGNYGAAATCKVSAGKAVGLYVNYSEITVKDESVEKLYELLQGNTETQTANKPESVEETRH